MSMNSIDGGVMVSQAEHVELSAAVEALLARFRNGAERTIPDSRRASMSELDIVGAAFCAAVQALLKTDDVKQLGMESRVFTLGAAVATVLRSPDLPDGDPVPLFEAFVDGFFTALKAVAGEMPRGPLQ